MRQERTLAGDGLQVAAEDLDVLAAAWQGLLERSGRPWPFLSPAWQRVWWRVRPPAARPLLLSVREGGRLIGVAPLQQGEDRVAFAGDSAICDYMDVIAEHGRESDVLAAVLDTIVALPWQRCELWGLRADSPSLAALAPLAEQRGLELQMVEEAVCPRVALPASWDAYLEGLTKKDRHELRRKLRRFAEVAGEARVETLRTPAAVAAGLDDFLRLHTISREDKAEFMTPEMERFFRAMAAALSAVGALRLSFLVSGSKRIATVLAFECGDEVWLYNSGFDPAYAGVSVGLVSKALILRQAIEEGKRWYDFLRGAEPYKYHLGASNLEVFCCTLLRRTPAGVAHEG